MALQAAYLANAVFCLITFFKDWNLGAYFVLVAALAFVLQIILASALDLTLPLTDKQIAAACGFGSADAMRRSFARLVGVPPKQYRYSTRALTSPE